MNATAAHAADAPDTQRPVALRAEGLVRRFGGETAVSGLTLDLRRGEVVGLLGPNGAGKTTTLRLLSLTLEPDGGELAVDGIDARRDPRRARSRIGYLPDRPPLYDEMRVRGYLRFCARLRGMRRGEARAAADGAIDRCDLADAAHRLIGNLSLGYRQRLGIAQALVHRPPVIILDEPTVGLDPRQMERVRGLIAELRREHAVLLSSHVLPEVQAACDRVLILHRGEPVYSGDAAADDEDGWVVVRFAAPPPAEALAAVSGVRRVERLPAGRQRLRLDGPHARDAVLRAALAEGWGLREWLPPRRGLEQLFLALTQGEEAP